MAPLKPTFRLAVGSLSATSDRAVGGPTLFRVERDMDIAADALEVHLMDRSNLALGDDVSLDLGYDGENERVFSGRVVSRIPGIQGTRIRALGRMDGLLALNVESSYESQSAGSIASDLIGQAGLSAGTVDAGPTLPVFSVDARRSAFEHLKGLADRLGFELFADRDGAIHFRGLGPGAGLDAGLGAAGLPFSGGERYLLAQHLLKAEARDRRPAAGSVEIGGESPMSGEGETAVHWLTPNDADYRGSSGSDAPLRRVLDPLARTKDLADRFAKGLQAVAARRAREVRITILGRPGVDLGDSLSTGDLSDALAVGEGYVRAVRHRFDATRGYLTDMRISMEAAS